MADLILQWALILAGISVIAFLLWVALIYFIVTKFGD